MRQMTWEQVCAGRLRRHRLLEPSPAGELVAVASQVCGIHAQVMATAELSLGLRVAGITRQRVRDALWERRRLVKTYGPRGTVHLLPPRSWACGRRPDLDGRRDGLGPERMDALVGAIAEALDGRRLTRRALGEELAGQLGVWVLAGGSPAFGGSASAWSPALGEAALRGIICFGPNQGGQVTFARVDQWLGGGVRRPDGAAALAEVLRRFVAAYGRSARRTSRNGSTCGPARRGSWPARSATSWSRSRSTATAPW